MPILTWVEKATMKILSLYFALAIGALIWPVHNAAYAVPAAANQLCGAGASFYKRRLAGDQVDDICQRFAGKVMLIVNTASKCAFTDQYKGLEALYARYRDAGLVVVGFPSNDFGGQEPGSEDQIRDFCVNTYAVKFPMYEKTVVKGSNIDPLYRALIQASDSRPRWNFHKYLVDRNGRVVQSFASSTRPQSEKLVRAIERLLQQRTSMGDVKSKLPAVSSLAQ
jgi:glutathione peroxidase